jgi:cold shock protein
VKWYNAAKEFGFIVRDGGGNDVFVHVSALQRAGIMGLDAGQRVFVGAAEGQKGPEAASAETGSSARVWVCPSTWSISTWAAPSSS